jgi:Ricin-type beta-trefoil lectin domain
MAGMLAAALASAQNGFTGPGLYEIMNLRTSRMMALDMKDQTSVIQIASHSQEDQRWIVEPAGGAFLIRSAVNGRALQITNNARSIPVVVARMDGSPAQQWRFEDPGKDAHPLIVSAAGGRVLDIPNGSNKEGLRIQIYDREGNPNQRFVFHRVDERPDQDRVRRLRWDR